MSPEQKSTALRNMLSASLCAHAANDRSLLRGLYGICEVKHKSVQRDD